MRRSVRRYASAGRSARQNDGLIGFRYRPFSPAGDELGEFHTAVPNWQPGEKFLTGDGRRFRIVRIVPVGEVDSPYHGFVEVESVEEDS